MTLQQLSIFLENRPGHLITPCRVLAEAGINILTLSLADTQQFGILRLIVRDWQRAKAALEAAGCVVKVTPVAAVEVSDRPGGLADILAALEKTEANVAYLYAFTLKRGTRGVMVFRFDQPDQAIAALAAAGIKIVSSDEIISLLENDPRDGSSVR